MFEINKTTFNISRIDKITIHILKIINENELIYWILSVENNICLRFIYIISC